jgi:hypothetical protein
MESGRLDLTSDLLYPKQARYQAAPRPVEMPPTGFEPARCIKSNGASVRRVYQIPPQRREEPARSGKREGLVWRPT